jgi:hypothetical protein
MIPRTAHCTTGALGAMRGQCPVCRFRWKLRVGGTLQRHRSGRYLCPGSGGQPVPYDPDTCGPCIEYRFATPGLTEACYSVGIETGRDGAVLMREVLAAYHRRGHRMSDPRRSVALWGRSRLSPPTCRGKRST